MQCANCASSAVGNPSARDKQASLPLRSAESFVDDFFRPRWRFEIGVFGLFGIGRGQGIHQTVKWSKFAI